jgi:aminoglycoside phosphotransferase (APT) family kinase protein
VHFDLHPLNVLVTPTGPVVIDWPNAGRGDGCADVAVTWVLIQAGAIPAGRIKARAMGLGRSMLARSILGQFDTAAVRATIPEVVRWKLTDPHMSASEREVMQALAVEVVRHPDR